MKTKYEDLIKLVEFKNKKILDAGCGIGNFIRVLYPNIAKHIDGIDVSANAIWTCEDTFPELEFYCADIAGTKELLPRIEYDIVVCNSVLQYISQPKGTIDNLLALTKFGGVLLLGDIFDARFWDLYRIVGPMNKIKALKNLLTGWTFTTFEPRWFHGNYPEFKVDVLTSINHSKWRYNVRICK